MRRVGFGVVVYYHMTWSLNALMPALLLNPEAKMPKYCAS